MLCASSANSGRPNVFVEARDVGEAVFVEPKARFRGEDAPHGFVDALHRNAAGGDGVFKASECGVRHRRHEQDVRSRFDRRVPPLRPAR